MSKSNILAFTGAAIGFAIGGPVGAGALGAQIGFAAGSLAGAHLFPEKITEPLPGDTEVSFSIYGAPIPVVYGTEKVAGTYIWVEGNKLEVRSSTQRAGKATGPEITSHELFLTAAVLLCEGESAGIKTLELNGKVVMDFDGDALQAAIDAGDPIPVTGFAPGVTVRVLLGGEDQLPDSLMEAERGVGNVSAMRGLTVLIFDGLPVGEYGNRAPQVEATIIKGGTPLFPRGEAGGYQDLDPFQVFYDDAHVDRYEPVFYAGDSNFAPFIHAFSVDTLQLINSYQPNEGYARVTETSTLETSEKYLYSMRGGGIHIIDKHAMTFVTKLTYEPNNPGDMSFRRYDPLGPGYCVAGWADVPNGGWIRVIEENATLSINEFTPPRFVTDGFNTGFYDNITVDIGPEKQIWTLGHKFIGSTPELRYHSMHPTGDIPPDPTWYIQQDLVFDLNSAPYNAGGGTGFLFYWPEGDVLIVGTNNYLFQLDKNTGDIINSLDTFAPTGLTMGGLHSTSDSRANPDGTIIIWFAGGSLYQISLTEMRFVREIDFFAYGTSYDPITRGVWYMPDINAFMTNIGKICYLDRVSGDTTTVGEVIAGTSARCGLDPSQYDTTDIDTIPLPGHAIRRVGVTGNQVIAPLQNMFSIDQRVENGVITYIQRGKDSVRTLDYDDLGAVAEGTTTKSYTETNTRTKDLYKKVKISYRSFDANFKINVQQAGFASDVAGTERILHLEPTYPLWDDQAAQLANIIWKAMWNERRSFSLSFALSQLDLLPGDVITVPIDGELVELRITEYTFDGTVKVTGVQQHASSYSSTSTGDTIEADQNTLTLLSQTNLLLLDTPMLRNDDDDDGFYLVVYRRTPTRIWDGSTVFKSDDGTSYTEWQTFDNEGIVGSTSDVLLDTDPALWDRASTLTIQVKSTGFVPVSSTEALVRDTDLNPLIVVSAGAIEYVNYVNVTDNLDGTYTLDTFLRGRRNTNEIIGNHSGGSLLVFPTVSSINRISSAVDRNVEKYYEAMSNGLAFEVRTPQAFTNTAQGRAPWSVNNIVGVRNAALDLDVTWNRRSRITGPGFLGESIALAEETEAYKLYIYNAGTLVRTISSAVESAQYTVADQITDFGSAQASIDVGVVQVGRYGDGTENFETL